MSKNKIEVEGKMELTRAVEYLEQLLDGLKSGNVQVQSGEECATLCPPSVVDFELEVVQKKEKNKIAFEIAWKHEPCEDLNLGCSSPEIAETE